VRGDPVGGEVKHRGQGIHGTEDASEELESVLTPAQLKKLDLAGNVPAQLMTVSLF
jgi:hypothetical protein